MSEHHLRSGNNDSIAMNERDEAWMQQIDKYARKRKGAK